MGMGRQKWQQKEPEQSTKQDVHLEEIVVLKAQAAEREAALRRDLMRERCERQLYEKTLRLSRAAPQVEIDPEVKEIYLDRADLSMELEEQEEHIFSIQIDIINLQHKLREQALATGEGSESYQQIAQELALKEHKLESLACRQEDVLLQMNENAAELKAKVTNLSQELDSCKTLEAQTRSMVAGLQAERDALTQELARARAGLVSIPALHMGNTLPALDLELMKKGPAVVEQSPVNPMGSSGGRLNSKHDFPHRATDTITPIDEGGASSDAEGRGDIPGDGLRSLVAATPRAAKEFEGYNAKTAQLRSIIAATPRSAKEFEKAINYSARVRQHQLEATEAAEYEREQVTLYYRTGWNTCFLHYRTMDQRASWRDAVMQEALDVGSDWKKISLDANEVEFVLCNATRTSWDNPPKECDAGQNYIIKGRGTYFLRDGLLKPLSESDRFLMSLSRIAVEKVLAKNSEGSFVLRSFEV